MRKAVVTRAHSNPVGENVCTGRDLANALRKFKLTADEAKAWRRDLKVARKALRAPAQMTTATRADIALNHRPVK
jgi:hypothetical protein